MNRKKGMRFLAVCAGTAIALQTPAAALAASPGFARTSEEWARLQDNVLEYEELEGLIEEYNTTVLNNQQTYNQYQRSLSFDDFSERYLKEADEYYNMAGHAGTELEAIGYEMQARTAENSAAFDEQDAQTISYTNQLTEKLLVQDAQNTMNSYYQLQQQLISAQKSRELLEALVTSAETRFSLEMATQADVNTAKQNLQNADAQILALETQIESARQKLIVMTGWKADGTPEIRPMPEVNFEKIAQMDLTKDLETALANDYTLKLDQYKAQKVSDSANQKIYQQTVDYDKEQIAVALNSAYQAVNQAKSAYDEAVLNMDITSRSMATASAQYELGSISRLEHRQAEVSYVSAQTNLEIKRLALLQAMEAYDWVVKGVRS